MNRKHKIAYIVPSDLIRTVVTETLSKEIAHDIVDVVKIDVNDPDNEYRRLCREGYSCIIARGGTYIDLKKAEDTIPVFEEKLSTADVAEMIAARAANDEFAIYVVIYKGTADGAESLAQLTNGRVRVLRYSSLPELKSLIEGIPERGVKVFTSGYAASISTRPDLEFIELQNQPHTVRETVETARVFLGRMQDNIQQVNTLNSIYNNIDEGIIIFDIGFVITEINARALGLLRQQRGKMIGRSVRDLIPELPEIRGSGLCTVDSPRTFTGRLGDKQISYTVYPFDFFKGESRYMMILQDVTRIQTLEHSIRVQMSKKGLVAKHDFSDILTDDPEMKRIINKARTVSQYEGSVLIYGESGTGKELFAQSIHNSSKRSNGPFVAINCGALTESLLESELFGYVGGAFTGARKEGKAGLFELAHNGTIFLDEINSTPLSLQTKILRVIESQQVMRVGSDYVIPLNVRIISACNSDLMRDIDAGRFRQDLYFRLNTFEVTVPPLRERRSDILMLFRHYLAEFSDELVKADEIRLDPALEKELIEHSWLGNVREIRSSALRYNAFGGDNSSGDIIRKYHISEPVMAASAVREETGDATSAGLSVHPVDITADAADSEMVPLSELSAAVESLVIQSLENKGLSRTDIARALGISRQALYKKLNKNN